MNTQNQNQQEIQINPLTYLKIFFRRKWFVIIPSVLGLGISFMIANTLPKIYESYTVILIEEERRSNPALSGLAVFRSARERVGYLRDQILSWSRLVKLTEKLSLAEGIKNQQEFESLIFNDLRKNITVSMRGPSLVRIGFQGEDPNQAQQIVKTIGDIFIEENIAFQQKESEVAISFLEEQLKIYNRKIKDSQIAAMEDKLKALLMDSTEAHPMVRDLKTKIAKAKEEMEEDPDVIVENPQFIKNPVLDRLQEELAKEISNIESQDDSSILPSEDESEPIEGDGLYKVALMSNISRALAKDLSVNQMTYNMLLEKLETARISKRLAASKEGTRYAILDPARVPLKPTKPNKPLIMLIGALIGAGLGFGVIVLLEVLDRSFLGVDEAKAVLDLPILGAISKITTAEDVAIEKKRRSARIWTLVVSSLVFVHVVIIYSLLVRP